MSLLMVDADRETVSPVTDYEWRAIRMLRLLDSAGQDEICHQICARIAEARLPSSAANSQSTGGPQELINSYLSSVVRRASPVADDLFSILVDCGQVDDIRGEDGLDWMFGDVAVEDGASELCDRYEGIVSRDSGYSRVKELYPDADSAEGAWVEFVDHMTGVMVEWQDRFVTILEKDAYERLPGK